MNNEQSVEDFNVSPAIAKPMLAAGLSHNTNKNEREN